MFSDLLSGRQGMLKYISAVMVAILLIVSAAIAMNSIMGSPKEGALYHRLTPPAAGVPDIAEVFSFTCQHCYRFSAQWHISAGIKNYAKNGFSYEKYHVPVGPLGQALSEAWAVAVQKNIEDYVATALFHGVQTTREINSEDDVISIFEKKGITRDEYSQILKQDSTQAFIQRQSAAVASLNVQAVPGVYITGDKLLRTEKILPRNAPSDRYASVYVQAIDDILHPRNIYH